MSHIVIGVAVGSATVLLLDDRTAQLLASIGSRAIVSLLYSLVK